MNYDKNTDFEDFTGGFTGGFSAGTGNSTEDFGTSPHWSDYSPEDHTRAKKKFSRFFLSLFVYLIVANVVAIAIQVGSILLLGAEEAAKLSAGPYFVWIVQVLSMYVIAFPAFYLINHGMKSVIRTKGKMKITDLLVTFLIAEGLMVVGSIVSNILTSVFTMFFGYELNNNTSDIIMSSPIWLIILVAVIIGPIVEELMFRKLLMDKLGAYGDRICIIVSAVSFGIFHGNLFQVFYAAMLGALLAYVYSKTGNVIYTIILHIAINFFGSVLPMLIMEPAERLLELSEQVTSGAEVDYAEYLRLTMIVGSYSMVQYGLAIAGIVLLISKLRNRQLFVSDRCEVLIPKERRASVIVGNVGAILFLVIIGLTFITSLMPDLSAIVPEGSGEAILKGLRLLIGGNE